MRITAAIATIGIALCAAATTAPAAVPAPCGDSITDVAGDAYVHPAPGGGPTSVPAPKNLDLRQAFFTLRDGALQVHIQVEHLDRTKSSEVAYPNTPTWEVRYSTPENDYIALAKLSEGQFLFEHWTDNGAVYRISGTTGRAHEGPGGVLTINLPLRLKSGAELTGVSAESVLDTEAPLRTKSDTAPDADGTNLRVAECVEAPASPPATSAPPTGPAPAAFTAAAPAPVAAPANRPAGRPAAKPKKAKAKAKAKPKRCTKRAKAKRCKARAKARAKRRSGRAR